ncbi:MAG: lipid-A-disaccharide synthase [Candidatus Omnitrophota bacterium]
MDSKEKHILIIAGEASGDMHAASLVDEIKLLDPSIIFSGVGGGKMRASGVKLFADITDLAVVGFVEVLKHFSEIKKIFNLVLAKIDEIKPTAVILVDYPGFNLRLARELKKKGVKVIYYISPQIWAWKEDRVALIKECVDKMLVLFQFEKELYAKHGIDADFVGHPLLDMINVQVSRDMLFRSINFATNKLTIGLLPGSRQKEVETHLPVMLGAANILYQQNQKLQFLLMRASTISKSVLEHPIRHYNFPIKIIDDQTYVGINACDICMVASGTATLETAILQKPMVVIYKTSLLTWMLAKLFVKIPCIGLVNIVAGQKIVPECIQFEATAVHIANELKSISSNEFKMNQIKSALGFVKSSLGEPGASRRAAESVLKII